MDFEEVYKQLNEAFGDLDPEISKADKIAASKDFWNTAKEKNLIALKSFHTAYDQELIDMGLFDKLFSRINGKLLSRSTYGILKTADKDSWAVKAATKFWVMQFKDGCPTVEEAEEAKVRAAKEAEWKAKEEERRKAEEERRAEEERIKKERYAELSVKVKKIEERIPEIMEKIKESVKEDPSTRDIAKLLMEYYTNMAEAEETVCPYTEDSLCTNIEVEPRPIKFTEDSIDPCIYFYFRLDSKKSSLGFEPAILVTLYVSSFDEEADIDKNIKHAVHIALINEMPSVKREAERSVHVKAITKAEKLKREKAYNGRLEFNTSLRDDIAAGIKPSEAYKMVLNGVISKAKERADTEARIWKGSTDGSLEASIASVYWRAAGILASLLYGIYWRIDGVECTYDPDDSDKIKDLLDDILRGVTKAGISNFGVVGLSPLADKKLPIDY